MRNTLGVHVYIDWHGREGEEGTRCGPPEGPEAASHRIGRQLLEVVPSNHVAITESSVAIAQCSYAVALRGLDNESYHMLMKRAREALIVAYKQVPNQWSTVLLYAIMLIELHNRTHQI